MALQCFAIAAGLQNQLGTAVPADVDKGPQLPGLVTRDHKRHTSHGTGEKITRLCYLLDQAHILPGMAKDTGSFLCKDMGISIPVRGQRVALFKRV